MSRARVCICGGGYIAGPFGPGAKGEAAEQAQAEALYQFLQQTGSASEDTIKAWVEMRERLAIDLALVYLLETGETEVVGRDAHGEMLFANRTPTREPAA